MKRRIVTASVIALVFALSVSAALAKANFSGTWVMDASKSEGIPTSIQQEMTVVQTDDTIKLETKVKTDEGDFAIADSYTSTAKKWTSYRRRLKGQTAKASGPRNGLPTATASK